MGRSIEPAFAESESTAIVQLAYAAYIEQVGFQVEDWQPQLASRRKRDQHCSCQALQGQQDRRHHQQWTRTPERFRSSSEELFHYHSTTPVRDGTALAPIWHPTDDSTTHIHRLQSITLECTPISVRISSWASSAWRCGEPKCAAVFVEAIIFSPTDTASASGNDVAASKPWTTYTFS